MLVTEYNNSTKEYRYYDKKLDWIVFSGFGKTKKEAKTNYFLTQIMKNQVGIISFEPCA